MTQFRSGYCTFVKYFNIRSWLWIFIHYSRFHTCWRFIFFRKLIMDHLIRSKVKGTFSLAINVFSIISVFYILFFYLCSIFAFVIIYWNIRMACFLFLRCPFQWARWLIIENHNSALIIWPIDRLLNFLAVFQVLSL